MCGRYTMASDADVVARLFELGELPELERRYNIAPTQEVPVVRAARPGDGSSSDASGRKEGRRWDRMHWGLVPFWAKDRSIGSRLINARAETASEKPAFRAALKQRRCLIVADGFYEWRKTPDGKVPMYIRRVDGAPFAFAGLWEWWNMDAGEGLLSCTILTTEPNDLLAEIHNRMPVILSRGDYDLWLADDADPGDVRPLLCPIDSDGWEAYAVSKYVNRPTNDSPRCIEPAED